MKLIISKLAAFALVSASSIHATELRGGVANAGAQCNDDAIRRCGKKKCTATNTLEITCAGKGKDGATSSIGPTDISSRKEFREADVCKDSCSKGHRCEANWHGSWSCGDEGETMEVKLKVEDEDNLEKDSTHVGF
mmetsp:Transcript_28038/g.51726  ORF Transcript_28038/g.51726 Transcript_28038/m.51726 type:complete len:136 (-) Transcript_28038:143-550(-)